MAIKSCSTGNKKTKQTKKKTAKRYSERERERERDHPKAFRVSHWVTYIRSFRELDANTVCK